MSKKITIYDLADMLNLSPATISRSLNDHPSISTKTKKLVVSKANEVGYKTNKFAANFRNQKSHTIGVIVPRLNSYFMSTVLAGIEQVANKSGYNIIISQSLESEEKEKINTKTLLDSGVDALLVSIAYESINYDHFVNYTNRKIPLLFFDRVIDMPNCPTILIDNQAAGYEATKHLIKLGCQNLLHVSGNLRRTLYTDRYKGFKDALLENKMDVTSANLIESDLDPKKTQVVVNYIKNSKKNIDGIFVASDNFAANCIKELKKEGYRIILLNSNPATIMTDPNMAHSTYIEPCLASYHVPQSFP